MGILLRSHFVIISTLLVIFLILSLFTYPLLPVDANAAPVRDALNQSMKAMHTAMSSVLMTGNPDIDFAVMMIPHHQGAVEMAKVELRSGTDPRLRRLAQEIVVTQQAEIAFMQLTLKHPLSAQAAPSP